MINGYQAKIMAVYEKIRDEESKNLELRRNEIRNLYPEIMDIDNLIQKRSLQLSMAILKSCAGFPVRCSAGPALRWR